MLLSFVPIIAGAHRLATLAGAGQAGADSARFFAAPGPVVVHILSATVFCVLGAFQLDCAVRLGLPRLHRIAGRVVAPCAILAAFTGLWMTVGYPIPAAQQGKLLYGVRVLVGLSMMVAVVVSLRAVLERRLTQHKAWMVRAYALGQGAGTQVLLLLPVTWLNGAPTFILRDVLMATAWGLNLLVAEWIVRRRLPSP